MKAIIPAAGLGTRFLPSTKAQPKEMLPVLDKPAIQYVVEEALAAQADEVILVSNKGKQSIAEHFSPDEALVARLKAAGKTAYAEVVTHAGSLPVSFVEQSEPLGLGHAIHCAAEKVAGSSQAEPFFVLLGDVLVPNETMLPRMLEVSREHGGASVIAVEPVPHEQVGRFGIIGGEAVGTDVLRITELVEKPRPEDAPSNLSIFGRYLLTPRVMELLSQTPPGAGGEIQLTDALVALLDTEEIYALVIDEDEGFDVGTLETWLSTNIRLALRDPVLSETITGLALPV
jgi:UTP--glucose-1-phosphate uridylyltransferase